MKKYFLLLLGCLMAIPLSLPARSLIIEPASPSPASSAQADPVIHRPEGALAVGRGAMADACAVNKPVNTSPTQSVPCEKTRNPDKATEGNEEKEMVATENDPSTVDQTAQRAACSSAISKTRTNRRASATVKLVSN